jgi:hypothetical protein
VQSALQRSLLLAVTKNTIQTKKYEYHARAALAVSC